MYLYVLYIFSLCVSNTFAMAAASKITTERPTNDPERKREAPIPNGSGYHGSPHKYLPPRSSSPSGVYENCRSGPQSSYVNLKTLTSSDSNTVNGHTNVQRGGSAPRVETYFIQTQASQTDIIGPQNAVGYRYAAPPAQIKDGYYNPKSGYGGGYSLSHGTAQKYKAVLIPIPSFTPGANGDGGYTRLNGKSGIIGRVNYSNDATSPYFSAGSYAGNNYDTKLATLSGSENGAHSSIGTSDNHGLQSYNHGSTGSTHSIELMYHGSDYSGTQEGYFYEKPISSFSDGSEVPSASYGAPIGNQNPAYAEDDSSAQQTPAYAAGHNELGYFSYEARRPHPLSTDFSHVNQYQNSYGDTVSHGGPSIVYSPKQYIPPPPTSVGYEYSSQTGNYGASNQYT